MGVPVTQGHTLRNAMLGVGMLAAVAYWLVPYSSEGELLIYDGVVLMSTIAAVVGWRRAPAAQRFGWGCVSAALALFLLGELIWWGLSAPARSRSPRSQTHAFLLGYVPLAIAAAALAAAWSREPDRSAWLDAGVLTAVAGIVIFNVLMEPYVHDPSSTAFAKLATIAYPLADILDPRIRAPPRLLAPEPAPERTDAHRWGRVDVRRRHGVRLADAARDVRCGLLA